MSEEVPETTDGAIRGWIVAVAFTLVLVGGELMSEKDGVRFWTGVAVAVAGLPCYLTAAWWKTLKPKLDGRFLVTLNAVATDARWWAGCLFVVLLGLIFSQGTTLPWPKTSSSAEMADTVPQKDFEALGAKLEAMTNERNDLKQTLESTDEKLTVLRQNVESTKNSFSSLVADNEKLEANYDDMKATFEKEVALLKSERDALKQRCR